MERDPEGLHSLGIEPRERETKKRKCMNLIWRLFQGENILKLTQYLYSRKVGSFKLFNPR